MLGGDAARVLGRDVDLLELGVVALLVHGVVNRHELVHVDLARHAVDRDLGAPVEVHEARVALGKGLLETVEQVELVDVLLLAQRHERFHHRRCHVSFLPGLYSIRGAARQTVIPEIWGLLALVAGLL